MKKPIIEKFEDIEFGLTVYELSIPKHYMVTAKHPRWTIFWWLVKLAWKGTFGHLPTTPSPPEVLGVKEQ